MPSAWVTGPAWGQSSERLASYSSENRHKLELVLKRVLIVLLYSVLLIGCLILLVLYLLFMWPAKRIRKRFSADDEPLTNDWWGLHAGDDVDARDARKPKDLDMRHGVELTTCYITTRDGVKLATDVWIPKKALEKKGRLPVIFHQARYYRSATLRWPFNLVVNGGKPISFINDPFFKSFLSYDMILVSVDVRGTGASFGKHPGPWSPEEQQDSLEVLDWIDRQPWSSGKVGLWGVSYEGTSAFFTSLLRHPTVVCCCPMFFFWEVYDDISHPGGIPMRHFSVSWQGFNDSLDSGWVQSTGWMARIFLEGVSPVRTEDPWGYQAKQALAEHKGNWSLLEDDHIRYMDDTSKRTGRTVQSACASQGLHQLLVKHGVIADSWPPSASGNATDQNARIELGTPTGDEDQTRGIEGLPSGAGYEELKQTLPFYLHVSGWLDASANAAVMAFMTVPCRGSELLVGPWNHGGHQHVRPHHVTSRSRFDFRTEVSGFFVRRMSAPSEGSFEGVQGAGESKEALSGGGGGATTAVGARGEQDTSPASTIPPSPGASNLANVGFPHEEASTLTAADTTAIKSDPPYDSLPQADVSKEDEVTGIVGAVEVEEAKGGEREQPAEEPSAAGSVWQRARPRVRFYTHQEERWHEADTFPSTPTHRADVVLSLGKRRPPPPPVTTPSGVGLVTRLGNSLSNTRHTSLAFFRAHSFGGGAGTALGGGGDTTEGGSESSRKRIEGATARGIEVSSSVSKLDDDAFDEGGGQVGILLHGDGVLSPHSRDGASASLSPATGAEGSTHAAEAKRERKEDVPIGHLENDGNVKVDAGIADNPALDAGVDGPGRRVRPTLEVEVPAALDAEDADGPGEHVGSALSTPTAGRSTGISREATTAGDGVGGVISEGTRAADRLSLRRWRNFRKPKLILSQDPIDEEEVHELEVDVENDRDGEGVSRWAAMTEFLSLISYQMDGLRSNHLRFTSPPLKHDMEVTGYPVVTLWVSAADDLPNLDVFAYLQAVRPRTGLSIYVTEGCFRAEHRKERERRRPIEVRTLPGVPIHSYLRADAQPLDKCRPVEIVFKLMPTSFKFLKGQRVRLSVGGADARHFYPITRTPPEPSPPAPGSRGSINPVGGKDPPIPDMGVPLSPANITELVGVPVDPTIARDVPVVDVDAEGGVAEADPKASVTKRILRVHTGGDYASSVSLPVPRSAGGAGGLGLAERAVQRAKGEEVDKGRGRVPGGRGGGGGHEALAGDTEGARGNVATPRTEGFARALWSRRPRSLSSPDISTALASHEGPLREGRWTADLGVNSSSRGRRSVQSLGPTSRRDASLARWGDDYSRIFMDERL